MFERTALILLDSKPNRHSLNALLGALEADGELDDLEIRWPAGEGQLGAQIARARAGGKRPIVALSFTTPQLWRISELVARLRAQNPGALWVAGGPHPTADPQATLRLGFDVVVLGEGEATLPDLLKTIDAGGDLARVAGIAFESSAGAPHYTPRRTPIELDSYPPFPLRRRRRVGPIEITRGCPFACGFCQTTH
ncbi:MAG: cobalamin-dependent protein, partial [Thermoguttaceae bacterium]